MNRRNFLAAASASLSPAWAQKPRRVGLIGCGLHGAWVGRCMVEAEYGPGPGFLPFWIGVVLVVLSGFLFIEARREDLRVDESPEGEGDSRSAFLEFAPGAFGPWAIFFVSTLAVSLLFERLGFALSVGLFMLVTMRWVARRRWRPSGRNRARRRAPTPTTARC